MAFTAARAGRSAVTPSAKTWCPCVPGSKSPRSSPASRLWPGAEVTLSPQPSAPKGPCTQCRSAWVTRGRSPCAAPAGPWHREESLHPTSATKAPEPCGRNALAPAQRRAAPRSHSLGVTDRGGRRLCSQLQVRHRPPRITRSAEEPHLPGGTRAPSRGTPRAHRESAGAGEAVAKPAQAAVPARAAGTAAAPRTPRPHARCSRFAPGPVHTSIFSRGFQCYSSCSSCTGAQRSSWSGSALSQLSSTPEPVPCAASPLPLRTLKQPGRAPSPRLGFPPSPAPLQGSPAARARRGSARTPPHAHRLCSLSHRHPESSPRDNGSLNGLGCTTATKSLPSLSCGQPVASSTLLPSELTVSRDTIK